MKENEDAFTGLEAAIVLIAFVVVAAVFSYVMLGAGFYTTQKSQEVVHNSIQKASSGVVVDGDVIVRGGDENGGVDKIYFYVTNTAGSEPVDMHKTIITYTDNNEFETHDFFGNNFNNSNFNESYYLNNSTYLNPEYLLNLDDSGGRLIEYQGVTIDPPLPIYWVYQPVVGNDNQLLEKGEKHKIIFTRRLDTTGTYFGYELGSNFVGQSQKFKIEMKPPNGAPISIERTTPSSVNRGEYVSVY